MTERWLRRARLIWVVMIAHLVAAAAVALGLNWRLVAARADLERCELVFQQSEDSCFRAKHEHWPECPTGDMHAHVDIDGVHGCARLMYLSCDGGVPSISGYLDPRGMKASWGCEPGCPFPDMIELPRTPQGQRRCAQWEAR